MKQIDEALVNKHETPSRLSGKRGSLTLRDRRVIAKEPIHEQIIPYIREDIVSNRWLAGERLSEADLCKEFGVSRTPLRDVLKILEVEGLISLIPHVGAVVTEIDPPDLAEKLAVMSALEQAAVQEVTRLQSPHVLREIKRIDVAMEQAALARSDAKYYSLNDGFHRAIVNGCGNATLARMHETVMWHVSRARNYANKREQLSEHASENHREILEYIFKGDADGARHAMTKHLDTVTDKILRVLRGESNNDL